jgi:hypothetical protein
MVLTFMILTSSIVNLRFLDPRERILGAFALAYFSFRGGAAAFHS